MKYSYIASKMLLKYIKLISSLCFIIFPPSFLPFLLFLHQIQSDSLQGSPSYLGHGNVQVIHDTPPSLENSKGATHLN